MPWRMSRKKGEDYFREEASILYGQGKDVAYIAKMLNTNQTTVERWIKETTRKDLYVDFNGVWEKIDEDYLGDCQSLANELKKEVKLVDGRRQTVYYPHNKK